MRKNFPFHSDLDIGFLINSSRMLICRLLNEAFLALVSLLPCNENSKIGKFQSFSHTHTHQPESDMLGDMLQITDDDTHVK